MKPISTRYVVLALALMLATSAFAKPKSESITLYHDASLNGTNLPAGNYVVTCDMDGPSTQVKFMQGNKEVAAATGQVKVLSKKAVSNQVVLSNVGNTRNISEIDFGGKDKAVSFDSATTATGK